MNFNFINLLINKHLTISSTESFTGGLFASELVKNSGASNYFLGGIISYSVTSKINILKIDSSLIKQFGTISKQVSKEMALKGQELFQSDISISFTGNSGPNPAENKPTGLFYITIYYKEFFKTFKFETDLNWNRIQIQQYALECADILLSNFIQDNIA